MFASGGPLIAVKFGIGGCLKRAAGSGSLHHHHPQHCPSCFFLMCQFPSIVSCGKLRRLAVQAGYERQARAREQTNAEKSRRSSGKTWSALRPANATHCDLYEIKTTSSHGYDDILFGRDEILEEWPPESGVLRTGLPGRPSKSKEWIEGELERRIGAGEITSKTTLAETARSILESLPSDYARPTVGVIKNRIRRRFNEARLAVGNPNSPHEI